MSYFLVFLAVALAGLVAFFAVGLVRTPPASAAGSAVDGLSDPPPGLPPVLLPEQPSPRDVDRVRFALGLRGYRMDQVDEVLDRLRDELAARDEEIRELKEQLEQAHAGTAGRHPDGAAP